MCTFGFFLSETVMLFAFFVVGALQKTVESFQLRERK